MEANYDRAIRQWYAPAARAEPAAQPERVNTVPRSLGQDIVWSAPKEYVIWLVKAFRQAVRQTLDDLAESVVGLFSIILLTAAIIVKRSWPPRETLLLLRIAVVYWASSIALPIIVCPPLGRMTDAAALLFPSVLLACAGGLIFGKTKRRRPVETAAGNALDPVEETA